MSPEKLVEICKSLEDNVGVAFTYNEPSIWYEYVYNASRLLKKSIKDINIVIVSNGYIKEEPLKMLLPYVDTIVRASKECHVEVTTLLVNGENDSRSEIDGIAGFIASINKDIPLHLSRYFPNYKMENPATVLEVMYEARDIAKQHLNYVYLGNVAGTDNSTYCPKCGYKLIYRDGYHVHVKINEGTCPKCRFKTNIIL